MNKKSGLALSVVVLVVLLVVVAFIVVRVVFSPQPGMMTQSMPQSAAQSISQAQSQSSPTVAQPPPPTAPKSLTGGRDAAGQSTIARSTAPTQGNSNPRSGGTAQEPTRSSVYRQGWCPGAPPPYDLKNPPADLTPPDGQSPDHPQGEWVAVFEKQLAKNYGIADHYLYTGGGKWWVWVKGYDTGCNPFVTIDQYTGWQHG